MPVFKTGAFNHSATLPYIISITFYRFFVKTCNLFFIFVTRTALAIALIELCG